MTNENRKENRYELRASGLPGAADCWRRWAAGAIPNSLRAKGFEVRRRGTNIGAAVGIACHQGVNDWLAAVITGTQDDINPVAVASKTIIKQFDDSIDTDTCTPTVETAQFQVDRMVRAYLPVARKLKPKRVEFSLEAQIAKHDGRVFFLTGHPDIQTADDRILDLKFGKSVSQYHAQVGAYSLLAQSNGMNCAGVEIHHVQRVAKTKPQPDPNLIKYDLDLCEKAAHETVTEAVERVNQFEETGDPWAFSANPSSMLCSRKWCPVWGTEFCTMGKPEREID